MKIIEETLNKVGGFIKSSPALQRFFPAFEAFDEFLLGTNKTTRFSPHILDRIDIKRYMTMVIVALGPAIAAGIYFYGLRVLAVILVSYVFGGLTEVLFSVFRKKPVYEGFLVTGMIFPLILPPTIPLWMVAVGIIFGIFFGKEVFGGTGRNIFNPALVGRVFLSMAFPSYFATMWQEPFVKGWGGIVNFVGDTITSATPLINFKSTQIMTELPSLLLGTAAGSIGETFRLGIIFGGAVLIIAKIADWRIPFSYLLSAFIFSLFANSLAAQQFAPPLFQLLSGGLLFGAFFMATDPVTAPLTSEGRWVYGILLGILTVLIRGLSGFAEGVMFAILLMNAMAPLIDTIVINFKFKQVSG
jgi:RnfABCDGE-type electron transport complex D subunit